MCIKKKLFLKWSCFLELNLDLDLKNFETFKQFLKVFFHSFYFYLSVITLCIDNEE